jgi:hypothetical protein
MFQEGSWTVPSIANQDYLLDCAPDGIASGRWYPRVVIYRRGQEREPLHVANPRVACFDTAREAAEMGASAASGGSPRTKRASRGPWRAGERVSSPQVQWHRAGR